MDVVTSVLGAIGSGIGKFISYLIAAIVPNLESLVYEGSWTNGVWTKATNAGFTTLFAFIIVGVTIGAAYGIFRLVRALTHFGH